MSEIVYISFETKDDFDRFSRKADGAKLSLEELRDIAKETNAEFGKIKGKNTLQVELGAQVSGVRELKVFGGLLSETAKGTSNVATEVRKLYAADEKSLISRRQALNQARQMLAAMDQLNPKYAQQRELIESLTVEVRRLKGIQKGSVADINEESKVLQQRLQYEALSIDQRKQLTDQISRNNIESLKAQGVQEGSIKFLQAQRDQQYQLVQSLKAGSAAQREAADAVRAYDDQIRKATPQTFSFFGALNKLATIQAGLTAITAAISSINGAVNRVVTRTKEIEGFNLALQNIGFTATEAGQRFGEAATIASELGAPLEQVEKSYKRILPPLRQVGASADDQEKFIRNLSARTQVLGLSAEQSGRYMEAFAQVLSKGKLQSEELNQQISELDGSFRGQLADALGVTTSQLEDMIKNGEVTASVFYKAFNSMQNGAVALEGKIKSGNATIQQLQNIISTINTKTLETIGKALDPGIRAFLRATETFARFSQFVAQSALGELFANIFNQIGKTVENLVNIFTRFATVVINALTPVFQLVSAFTPLISVFLTFQITLNATALAIGAFGKATALLKTLTGSTNANIAALAGGVTNLGGAFGQLIKLNVAGFFRELALAAFNFVKALNVTAVNNFATALVNLSKAKFAGAALDAATISLNNSNQGFQFLSNIIDLLPSKFGKLNIGTKGAKGGLDALANTAKTTSTYLDYSELVRNAGTSFNLFGESAARAGNLAGNASVRYKKYYDAVNGVRAGNAAATASAGGLATGFRAVALGAGKAFVATAVITSIVEGFMGFKGASDAVTKGTDEIDGAFKSLGISSSSLKGPIDNLFSAIYKWSGLKLVVDTITGIGNVFGYLGQQLGLANSIGKTEEAFDKLNKAAKDAGMRGLFDFANASKLTAAQAAKLTGGLKAMVDGLNKSADALDEEAKKLKESGFLGKTRAAQLEAQAKALRNQAADYQYALGILETYTAAERANSKEIKTTKDALEASAAALQQRIDLGSKAVGALQTKVQEQYNQGLITEGQLNLRNAAIAVAASQDKKAAIDAELKYVSNLRARDGAEREALRKRQAELENEQSLAQKELADARAAQLEAEKKRIQEVAQEAQKLAGIYQESAGIASGAFDNLGSSVGNALNELRDTIISQSVIEFTINGDDAVLQNAVALQGKILQFEYTIGKVKNDVNRAQRQFELEMLALKAQQVILEAKAGPDSGRARAVIAAAQQQLGIIQQVGKLNETIAKADDLALQAKTQRLQQAYNIAAATSGLPPAQIVDEKSVAQLTTEFGSLFDQATRDAGNIGTAIVSSFEEGAAAGRNGFDDLSKVSGEIRDTQREFNAELKNAITELTKSAKDLASKNFGVALGKELSKAFGASLDEFGNKIKDAPKLVEAVKTSGSQLKPVFDATSASVDTINNRLQTTNTLLEEARRLGGSLPTTGLEARAMGGPVIGGSSYLVNDGGGREAFVDMAGRAQLLPASRNIKWRAPGDGFIIPAPLTDDLIRNNKIKARITSVNEASKPRIPMGVSGSNISNSGNLIKQMGAMMSGGNTQRITNHVTIQSQSPVMDASKIMANVTKLRARRGIRQ